MLKQDLNDNLISMKISFAKYFNNDFPEYTYVYLHIMCESREIITRIMFLK